MSTINKQSMSQTNGGGAATSVQEAYNNTVNVVKNYRWTLSPKEIDEVPYIYLEEYKVDESTIQTQLKYYTQGGADFLTGNTSKMSPYENLFPRNGDPVNTYIFPYFTDVNYELNTPEWQSLDTLEQGSKFLEGAAGVLGGDAAAKFTQTAIQGLFQTAGAALAYSYPKVGIMDRPKLWQSHQFRTINIKFPLFNTYGPSDWKKNRELCWTLVNQNLFTKRNIAVGYPPNYYEVYIPGQHYSYAASVTNLIINNRGNTRTLKNEAGQSFIVPDVYEINMTLTDMVMPSRNQYQEIQEKEQRVTVR
jgi:hypothetical protein